jgi:hypothetical protein
LSAVTSIPFGEGDAVGDLPGHAVEGCERDDPRGEGLAGHQVEAAAVDVGVAAAVHDELVARWRPREPVHVGVGDERAVGLLPQQQPVARRHDQQAPVGEPVDTAGKRRGVQDDIVVSLQVDGDHLTRPPVGKPEPALVPTRLFAELDPGHQDSRLGHRRLASGGWATNEEHTGGAIHPRLDLWKRR